LIGKKRLSKWATVFLGRLVGVLPNLKLNSISGGGKIRLAFPLEPDHVNLNRVLKLASTTLQPFLRTLFAEGRDSKLWLEGREREFEAPQRRVGGAALAPSRSQSLVGRRPLPVKGFVVAFEFKLIRSVTFRDGEGTE
jgi:hypothetical protein